MIFSLYLFSSPYLFNFSRRRNQWNFSLCVNAKSRVFPEVVFVAILASSHFSVSLRDAIVLDSRSYCMDC